MTTDRTNCPKCDSSRLQYQENYGYWECLDCGYVWGFDEDDPDYDDCSEMCPVCLGSGKGLIGEECLICQGAGML